MTTATSSEKRRVEATKGKSALASPEGDPLQPDTRSKAQKETTAKEAGAVRNIGLDVAKGKIACCVVEDGAVVERLTVTSLKGLERVLGANCPKARVALEASREAWPIYRELTLRGHEVLLVDTTRVKQLGIGQHGRKTDRIDAEVLALALAEERIPKAHVLSDKARVLRDLLSLRDSLVDARSSQIVAVRGVLRGQGVEMASCATESFGRTFRETTMSDALRAMCLTVVGLLDELTRRIGELEQRLEHEMRPFPIFEALTSVHGVNLMVAATYISVVDNPYRFSSAHQVESYFGLVPSEDSSGKGKQRLGAISKQGNVRGRTMLVQAAWSIFKSADESDPLRKWAHAVAARRGKSIAVVALARRLCGLLWALWRDGTFYSPELLGRQMANGIELHAALEKARAEGMKRSMKKAKLRAQKRTRLQSPTVTTTAKAKPPRVA